MTHPKARAKSVKMQGRLSRASVGEFSASDWNSEGNSLLLSSKILRLQWLQGRRKLIRRLRHDNFGTVGHLSGDLDLLNVDTSLVKSSTLLIGYAIEMFLKAGLVKSLVGCPESLFSNLSRYKYSHNYLEIAKFIHLPIGNQDRDDLDALMNAVKCEARYPIAATEKSYFSLVNERRKRLSDNSRYKRYRLLVNRVQRHVLKLSGSPSDMLSTGYVEFDQDGYLCFRRGGGMPPRIIFKLGTKACEFTSFDGLAPFAMQEKPELSAIWDDAEIYEERLTDGRVKLLPLSK